MLNLLERVHFGDLTPRPPHTRVDMRYTLDINNSPPHRPTTLTGPNPPETALATSMGRVGYLKWSVWGRNWPAFIFAFFETPEEEGAQRERR
ncbi:hypothetical protein Trydic_g18170 [Trypoxylus dichotomus]